MDFICQYAAANGIVTITIVPWRQWAAAGSFMTASPAFGESALQTAVESTLSLERASDTPSSQLPCSRASII